MYSESLDSLTLYRVFLALGVLLDVVVIGLLVRATGVIRTRNRQLADNTKTLDQVRRMIGATNNILISLYPDTDQPESQPTQRMRKARVVEMVRRAAADED